MGEAGQVVAFEPEMQNCEWIKKSIRASELKNIVLEQAAVGESNGVLELFIGEKSGWHSLVTSDANKKKESVEVQVVALDDYLIKHPMPNLKAIKVDVEGFEKEVLLGAGNTLRNITDLVLFLDIHPSHGVKHAEIFSLLRDFGFEIYKEKPPFNVAIRDNEQPLEIIAVKKSAEQDVDPNA